ncbi:MAG: hypothetical protein K1X79_07825 [Oligoflexia bacterium]|nr:hypothetical protein [Oligoflexia bacterium]
MSGKASLSGANVFDGSGGHEALLAAMGITLTAPEVQASPPSEIGRRLKVQDKEGMLRSGYEITSPGASLAIGSRRPDGPSGIVVDSLYVVTQSGNVYHFSYRGEAVVNDASLETGVRWLVEKKSSGSRFNVEPDVSHGASLTVGRPMPTNFPFQSTAIVKIVALDAACTAE